MSEQVHHPLFARLWPRVARQLDRSGGTDHRRELVAGLEGRVIEIGAGEGSNFAHYPTTVTDVLAVEPEAHLRRLAEQRAARLDGRIRVVDGVAERLPAESDSFDAAVVSLVLCSVRDQPAALEEIRRVLRPGGRLRFFEHVAAPPATAHRWLQQLLDSTLWPQVAGGCHTGRDTLANIRRSGLRLTQLERLRFPATRLPVPTSPHIRGEALV
ncbi:class I SAM-dependent methyltransferase [Nesterenkonia sphaerica]|uniref:Class I SAM-dependent methyltransferase n=1 Tax=Nesterenkonia sphaerica TaxID=1804988 RepID=A0A5R9A3C3_9MICC|nr:class I SAM-dependent methyltransferase [Nesterenkonia sphaerica]TLP73181.1 class I SAM-dependent methyltransferase [Nesterenkonia sphaerica]